MGRDSARLMSKAARWRAHDLTELASEIVAVVEAHAVRNLRYWHMRSAKQFGCATDANVDEIRDGRKASSQFEITQETAT